MKSKLDLLIEVLQTMTDEEIVAATQNTSHATFGEFGLNEYEFCFEDERIQKVSFDYAKVEFDNNNNYVMVSQSLYHDVSVLENDNEIGRVNTLAA